jgi:tetratricopeptide (TPR) repeat protein
VTIIRTPRIFAAPPVRLGATSVLCLSAFLLLAPPGGTAPRRTRPPRQTSPLPPQSAPSRAAQISLARARQLLAQGADALAEKELRRAVSLAPRWVEARRELARFYTHRGEWPTAASAWRDVLALQRDDREAQSEFSRAQLYVAAGTEAANIVELGQNSNNPLSGKNNSSAQSTASVAQTSPRMAPNSGTPARSTGVPSATPSGDKGNAPSTPRSQNNSPAATAGNSASFSLSGTVAGTTGAPPSQSSPAGAMPPGITTPNVPSPRPSTAMPPLTANSVPSLGAMMPAPNATDITGVTGAARAPRTAWAHGMGRPRVTSSRRSGKATRKARSSLFSARRPVAGRGSRGSRPTSARMVYHARPVSRRRQAQAWMALDQAARALQARDYPVALQRYRRAYRLDPNNHEALLGVAETLSHLRRYPAAMQAYRRILAAWPLDLQAQNGLADAFLYQGRYSEALPIYRRAHARYPGDFNAAYRLARIMAWTGHYAQAHPYYRAALTLRPYDAWLWTQWGEALIHTERGGAARSAFERALQLEPNYAPALVGLGNLFNWNGEYEAAMSNYRAALRRQPRNVIARIGLADALTAVNAPSAAVPHYRAALAVEPSSQPALLGLARALIRSGEEDRGVFELGRFLQKDPNNEEALRLMAQGQTQRESITTDSGRVVAIRALERVLAEQDNADEQARTLIKIAEIKAARNDISGARAAYMEALRRSPLNVEIGVAYTQFLINWPKRRPSSAAPCALIRRTCAGASCRSWCRAASAMPRVPRRSATVCKPRRRPLPTTACNWRMRYALPATTRARGGCSWALSSAIPPTSNCRWKWPTSRVTPATGNWRTRSIAASYESRPNRESECCKSNRMATSAPYRRHNRN